MSKVTNLNRFRKDKARAEKRARADANAQKFGRSTAQKAAEASENAQNVKKLDGHALQKPNSGTKDSSETP